MRDLDASGLHVTGYLGPSPPMGSGSHRYYFYLYQQSGHVDLAPLQKDRARFQPIDYAEANELGSPLAVTFFKTSYDDKEL